MDLSNIYGPRPEWAHKGNFGNILVVCGSKLYSGSATLAACSALRAGADMVTVASCSRAADVAAHTLPDLITYPLKGDYVATKHLADILDLAHIRKINGAVIGCGMGRHASTISLTSKLVAKLNVPMVLDADALFALSQKPEMVRGKQAVLTPHAGELSVLLGGKKISVNFEERLAGAKEAAHKYKAVVLLKGHVDIITDGNSTITNNTGTAFMTKGGFGDTLSGIVAALLARGVGLFEAAYIGAYLNGKAGEYLAPKGETVVASDIFDTIGKAIYGA